MNSKNIIYVALALLFMSLYINGYNERNSLNNNPSQTEQLNYSTINEIRYSTFLDLIEQQKISDVVISGNNIKGSTLDGLKFKVNGQYDPNLIDKLSSSKIPFYYENNDPSLIGTLFMNMLPILLLIGVWIWFMRRAGGGAGIGAFSKSKAKLFNPEDSTTSFNDVAGIDEAKDDLTELVDFLKDPKKYDQLGAQIPKGCLLVGPPGTGKTLIAKAVAGEAGVPLLSMSGSEFVEMFVGVGASRVRDLFAKAKENAPCIIFIDEIDAVAKQRGGNNIGGNDEREQTLNQLLVEMDGFTENKGIIIMAATNRPDVLDKALLRPGRFDRQITVPNPDINGREMILNVHLKKVRLGMDVDARVIARGTPGFSGAQLANLVNEAALMAARRNKNYVTMNELEDAKDKVMMGSERRTLTMTDKEKELTAYHEAGHALCTLFKPASDPIHKATIIPRGQALGMVMRLPEGDRVSISYEKLKADLVVAMGGRVAEELIYGAEKVTTGASSDIHMATNIAKKMVTEWGMSQKLGKIRYSQDQQNFLGTQSNPYSASDATSELIDQEIKRIVDQAYDEAKKILSDNKNKLELLTKELLEKETLDGKEIHDIVFGKSEIYEKKSHISSIPKLPKIKTQNPTI